MSEKRNRRFAAGDPRATADQYRQDMFQRRQANTVSIRKQRKEDMLWRRRQPQISSNKAVTVDELLGKLDAFLDKPHELARLQDLQTFMSMDSASTHQFLKYTIENHEVESKNRFWIATTSKLLQVTAGSDGMDGVSKASLAILMDLSSFSSVAPKPTTDDYYGRTPLRWSDLIHEEALLIDLFLARIREPSSSGQVLESVCSILGNLLQDSARSLPLIWPAWPDIVRKVPISAYLCATIVRQDSTHYGISFLHDLTPEIIAKLLRENITAVEASWILEGLSRREKESIQTLCESATLISSIISTLTESTACSNASVLVPLLRAVGNFINSGGLYAHALISQPTFVPAVSQLLEQNVIIDSLGVTGALLIWNRRHHHAEIGIIPTLNPTLVRIITSPEASFSWKRDAAWALSCSIHDDCSDEQPQVKEVTNIWLSEQLPVPHSDFIFSMIELLGNPDVEAVVSAVHIIDHLLRTVQPTRRLFDNAGGVERLDTICEKGGRGGLWDVAANVAADLLDDFYENDVEEKPPCARRANDFVFGLADGPMNVNMGPGNNSGLGRGRGLTTPAWMQLPR